MKQNLQEVIRLRNQLFRAVILRESHLKSPSNDNHLSSSSYSSLSDNQNESSVDQKLTIFSIISPRTDWKSATTDSGFPSDKSDPILTPTQTKTSSIPRLIRSDNFRRSSSLSSSFSSSGNNSPTPKFTDSAFKNDLRDELASPVQQFNSENQILKRQQDSELRT